MSIIRFAAQNVKKIKAIEINPDGDVVRIKGANGAGKSSVIQTILTTLCGGELPVRRGQEKGTVEIDLENFKIKRTVGKRNSLTVKSNDGSTYPSPQKFLKSLLGDISADPLAFARMGERDRIDALYAMCPDLQDVVREHDAEIEEVKRRRSSVLASTNAAEEAVKAAPAIPEDTPEFPVSVEPIETRRASVAADMKACYEAQSRKDSLQAHFNKNQYDAETCATDIKNIEAQLVERKKALASLNDVLSVTKEDMDAFVIPELPDATAIEHEYKNALEVNAAIAERERQEGLRTAVGDSKALYSSLLGDLQKAQKARADALSAAIPIPDLEITDGVLMSKGGPISELCTAERVLLGVEFAKAKNPKAKILLIDDASLLDSRSRAALHTACMDGYQIWEVLNDTDSDSGIIIEDGEVVNDE